MAESYEVDKEEENRIFEEIKAKILKILDAPSDLGKGARYLHSWWLETTANESARDRDWPYTEIIYNIVSMVTEVEKKLGGGNFSKEFMMEKLEKITIYVGMLFCRECDKPKDPKCGLAICDTCLEKKQEDRNKK